MKLNIIFNSSVKLSAQQFVSVRNPRLA